MAHARQTNYLIWLRTGAITSPWPDSRDRRPGQSFVAAATKLEQIPSLFLARFAIGAHAQDASLALGRGILALGDAGFGFGVQRLCFRCTTAHDRQRLDHHRALLETGANHKFIANARLLARFAAFTPAVHFAALNRRLGQGTGFVKTRRP